MFFKEAPGIHSPSRTGQQSSSPSLCCLGLGLSIQHKTRMEQKRLIQSTSGVLSPKQVEKQTILGQQW